jgi:hypothetical protein
MDARRLPDLPTLTVIASGKKRRIHPRGANEPMGDVLVCHIDGVALMVIKLTHHLMG